MIWRVATVIFEIAALGLVYALMRWTNKRIGEQLAGAGPAPEITRKASPSPSTQSPVFCVGCGQVHEPPLHAPRWTAALYTPCAHGFVAHQFKVESDIAAAHVILYRVPLFGREARA